MARSSASAVLLFQFVCVIMPIYYVDRHPENYRSNDVFALAPSASGLVERKSESVSQSSDLIEAGHHKGAPIPAFKRYRADFIFSDPTVGLTN